MKSLKAMLVSCCFACGVLATNTVFADVVTATFDIDKMNCESCPYIVKKAIGKLDGIISVEVSFEKKLATVIFNDQKVEIAKIEEVTRDAGFPASQIK